MADWMLVGVLVIGVWAALMMVQSIILTIDKIRKRPRRGRW